MFYVMDFGEELMVMGHVSKHGKSGDGIPNVRAHGHAIWEAREYIKNVSRSISLRYNRRSVGMPTPIPYQRQ